MLKPGFVFIVIHGYSRCGCEERAEDELWPVFLHISGCVVFVAGNVYQKFRLFGGQLCKTATQCFLALLVKLLAKVDQRQVSGKAFRQLIKHSLCALSVAAGLQDADKQVNSTSFLCSDGQTVALGIVESDNMEVGYIGVGDGQPAARHHALHAEHQSLFAMETADVALAAGKRSIDYTHDFVRLIRFRVERIVGVRTLQHNHLVCIVLIIVTKCTHLRFGYGTDCGFLVRRALSVVPNISAGIVVTEKLSQCVLGGKHEHVAVEKGQLLFIVTTAHVDFRMGGTIDFQYIPYLALFTLDECAKFRFMSGFGADKKPMVIYTVEFVGHNFIRS